MDFVPERASVVLKISDWEGLKSDIENNSLLSRFEKTNPYLFFSEEAPLLKNLNPTSQSLLCINTINDSLNAYTFISKQTPNLFESDSLKDKVIETLTIDKQSFQRITIDKKIAYTATVDSMFIASSSQTILMDILNGKSEREDAFKKVFELPTSSQLTALVRENKLAITDSSIIDLWSWTALDVSIAPESFIATGITLAADTIPQVLNIFEGQAPQPNELATLVPMDALGAMSFTFDDAEKLQNKLRKFRGEKDGAKTTGIFDSASEVGTIELKSGTAVFVKSIDPSITVDALARFVSVESSFREVEIKSFSEPKLFQKTFFPLINFDRGNYVFQLDNFFVFTPSQSFAQDLIAAYQNNSTLKSTSYFQQTSNDLSAASSLLIYKMQGGFTSLITQFFNINSKKGFSEIAFNKYPLAALQFSFDTNFAHVTLSCREAGASANYLADKVSEKFNTKLENTILKKPQIIGSAGNIVVQDIGNTLYYISESGKILWTKSLNSPILGKIIEVDFVGKGNTQLAFATKNAVYVLDKKGKDVKSFPLNFKDEITQPLSVFDYDKNNNYRLMIVQGKQVLLYNKEGKTVKGFSFTSAKSDILFAPIHVRMGRKDYIVIAEENGTLNLLSRVGKSRIPVSKKFNFSEIPITVEDGTFVVITKENTKERISEDGKISSQNLNVGNYWFTSNGNTKVTLDNNLLRIDGKLVELPIGLYSKPQLFYIHNKTYITITETQEKKVYVFNAEGILQKGFPIYGTSEASLGPSQSKKGINLAVQGDPKSIIVYTLD